MRVNQWTYRSVSFVLSLARQRTVTAERYRWRMKSGSFFRLSYTGNWARITCSRARMESHDAILPKPTASRAVNQRQIEIHSKGFRVGAGRGSRTPKTRRSADFESNPFIFQTTYFLLFAFACKLSSRRAVRFC